MSNILKTPVLSSNSKILSFDLESNGLHGEVFAIGAVLMTANGGVLDSFVARSEITGNVDEWVERNVLPVITDIEVTHSSVKHMRDHFWAWFTKTKLDADYVLVNNGYPVEYRFLAQCQDDDIETRYWDHPFPILDLTSMLVALGKDVQETKNKVMSSNTKDLKGAVHHPVYDAKLAALCAFSVMRVA